MNGIYIYIYTGILY